MQNDITVLCNIQFDGLAENFITGKRAAEDLQTTERLTELLIFYAVTSMRRQYCPSPFTSFPTNQMSLVPRQVI